MKIVIIKDVVTSVGDAFAGEIVDVSAHDARHLINIVAAVEAPDM